MIAPHDDTPPTEGKHDPIVRPPESTAFREAVATARHMSPDALAQWRDVLTLDLADDDPDHPGPVGRHLAGERLRAVDAELARRERVARASAGVTTPADRRYEDWRELARVVTEHVDVPDVLTACGVAMVPKGHNGRRGTMEYAGACPLCGGTDRLRSWDGPHGHAWCRVCGWSADAVAVAQSLAPGCAGFRDAVRWLATMAGTGTVPR